MLSVICSGIVALTMRFRLTSVFVNDQQKALRFYTEVLGFVKKLYFPVGQARWLTVVSPEEPEGAQLLLEPNDNPAARTFQDAVFKQGIPLASFAVEDVQREYKRLKGLGGAFSMDPTEKGSTTRAAFGATRGHPQQHV